MKGKVLLMAFAAASCCLIANAQEEAPTTQNKAGMHTVFARDKATDHWFIDIQGGAAMNLSGRNRDVKDFADRLSFTSPMLAIGKWHSPYFATRLQMTAWEIKGAMPARVPDHGKDGLVMAKNTYAVAHFDFLFDLNNYFGVYRPNKVFHVIPFIGMGVGYKFKSTYPEGDDKDIMDSDGVMAENERENIFRPTLNGGLMLKFRLSRVIDFNLEGQMMVSRLKFTGTDLKDKRLADLTAYASAGFTFNLGKTQWDEVVPMDYQLVNDLNAQINKLRAENEELSKRPVSCPECPEVSAEVVNKTVTVNNAVYFTINSAKIRKSQEINIYNTANYAKEKGLKIYLVGYADKNTGTSSYNMKLSERRAKAVADMLVNKYGVPADQIVSEWKGSDEQVYTENAWNRIVLMTAE